LNDYYGERRMCILMKNDNQFLEEKKEAFSVEPQEEKVLRSVHSWSRSLSLLKKAWQHPQDIGALWPSSRFLAKAMLEGIALQSGDVLVEYGPGTGPFTEYLKQETLSQEKIDYLGIEYDFHFYQDLKKRFPTLQFYHGSAAEVTTILQKYGSFRSLKEEKERKATYIISGLPFSLMPPGLQESILQGSAESLETFGVFRTFRYLFAGLSPAGKRFNQLVKRYFIPLEKRKIVWRNFPPAEVLSYRKA
jgi:phosphatidylethanolamine/phosphatidyl-N-methylethanolamine N-methyltransferase